jgi:hypothetical protein
MAPDRGDDGWTLADIFPANLARIAADVAAPLGRERRAGRRGGDGGRRRGYRLRQATLLLESPLLLLLESPLLFDSSSERPRACGIHAQIVAVLPVNTPVELD